MLSEYAIALPFTITSYGKVADTSDSSTIWADRLKATLGTGWGERLLKYEFGTTIYQEVFNTVSAAEEKIKTDISTAVVKFFPLLELTSVSTSWDANTNVINVTIFYKLPDNTDVAMSIGSVYIKGTQPPKEL